MKKLLIAVMLCALCVSFAACAGTQPEVTTEPTTKPTETSEPYDWSSALNSNGSGCAMEDPVNE